LIFMLRGSSLYSVVVLSLVIGLATTALMSVAFFYRSENTKNFLFERLERNAQSGMALILGGNDSLAFAEEQKLDLFGQETDSVLIKKDHWGLFEYGITKAFSGKYSSAKAALFGYKKNNDDAALFLADQSRPLSLCGSTFIKGTCFLPKAGVKRAFIEGESYSGGELINGAVKSSDNSLPALNKNYKERLITVFKSGITEKTDTVDIASDTIRRSFLEETLILRSDSLLRNKCYSGNIILFSKRTIVIDPSCSLHDILIFASSVIIKDGFKGSLQAFAKDSLVVGDHCDLKYPSGLGLIKIDVKTKQPFISIGEKTKIKGIVFSTQDYADIQQTKISIGKGTVITGQVYAEGFLELKGMVYGNVCCNKFTLKTPASVYENHLLNVTIDSSKLPDYYVGSSLIYSNNKKEIAKCLE
jgi:hypothetical protein